MTINGKTVLQKDIDRFWSRVDIGSEEECWEWQAGKNSTKKGFNYGIFWICGTGILTHRLALSFHLGEFVGVRDTMHSCDNPPCCNPFHLSPGTHLDNMRDMNQKGRRICEKGEERYNSKLTNEKVREIKRLLQNHQVYAKQLVDLKRKLKTTTKEAIAKEYGVDSAVILLISRGEAWRHIV